jgi:hypothetical protein
VLVSIQKTEKRGGRTTGVGVQAGNRLYEKGQYAFLYDLLYQLLKDNKGCNLAALDPNIPIILTSWKSDTSV